MGKNQSHVMLRSSPGGGTRQLRRLVEFIGMRHREQSLPCTIVLWLVAVVDINIPSFSGQSYLQYWIVPSVLGTASSAPVLCRSPAGVQGDRSGRTIYRRNLRFIGFQGDRSRRSFSVPAGKSFSRQNDVDFVSSTGTLKMAKCAFWYQLTRVVPVRVQRAVKWLWCVCV